jgi:hypothetical protein
LEQTHYALLVGSCASSSPTSPPVLVFLRRPRSSEEFTLTNKIPYSTISSVLSPGSYNLEDTAPMNPRLLASLIDESSSIEETLAEDRSSDATEAVRTVAKRNLNALVPEAIRTLETGLTTGLPADRRLAAQAILDRAPATAPSASSAPPAPSLPPEVASLFLSAISKMFSPLSERPAPERIVNEEVAVVVAEGDTLAAAKAGAVTAEVVGSSARKPRAPRAAAPKPKPPLHGARNGKAR